MNTPVTKNQVKAMSPIVLLQHVFGRKPSQTTTEFLKEVSPVKQDEKFIGECREFALASAA